MAGYNVKDANTYAIAIRTNKTNNNMGELTRPPRLAIILVRVMWW